MFGQLEDIERRFEEVLNELSEPGTTGDQKRYEGAGRSDSFGGDLQGI